MASPPQGFVVILPGEITQADLDPNQPPAKLSSYPLVAGKDVQPYPERQLVNDNSGNIATIIGKDTSSVTIPLSKLAALVASFNGRTGAVVPASGDYKQSQITHENGSVDEAELANDNSGTIATIIGKDTSSVTIPLSKLAALVASFNGRTGTVTPADGDYKQSQITHENGSIDEAELANDNSGTLVSIIRDDTSSITIPLSKLAALVASFNGRTGSVTPAPGDYSNYSKLSIAQGGGTGVSCDTGPLGIILIVSDVASDLAITPSNVTTFVLGSWVVCEAGAANANNVGITNNLSGSGSNDIVTIGL